MPHVLLIDDCPDFRAWARCTLEREGLEVIEARDALADFVAPILDALWNADTSLIAEAGYADDSDGERANQNALPITMAPPKIDHASGRSPKTSAPRIVANTTCR